MVSKRKNGIGRSPQMGLTGLDAALRESVSERGDGKTVPLGTLHTLPHKPGLASLPQGQKDTQELSALLTNRDVAWTSEEYAGETG